MRRGVLYHQTPILPYPLAVTILSRLISTNDDLVTSRNFSNFRGRRIRYLMLTVLGIQQ